MPLSIHLQQDMPGLSGMIIQPARQKIQLVFLVKVLERCSCLHQTEKFISRDKELNEALDFHRCH